MTNKELDISNTVVIPSLLLNSGFNVIAHLDWIQKMHGYNWSKEELSKKAAEKIASLHKELK
jgi:glutamate dehydrogenase/leucine dehydrogenase